MNPIDTTTLTKARDLLLSGDVVGMPTETVYGLAASIYSEPALRKVFSIKERPFFDPLIVHVASFKEAQSVVKEWPPLADYLARTFWPGPLTLVLPKADLISDLITSGLDTVAVRYPAHPVALDLIRMTQSPLAAPSANKFGRTSPSKAEHVRAEFTTEGLFVIDGGECEVGIESTVLGISTDALGEDEIQIFRPGAVTGEMLSEALTKWSRPARIHSKQSSASPGHLKHHYMPSIPLVIVAEDEVLGLSDKSKEKIVRDLKLSEVRSAKELKLNPIAALAARELYSQMRILSESGADLLYVRLPQPRLNEPKAEGQADAGQADGLWDAIWDRLTRAASLDLSGGK